MTSSVHVIREAHFFYTDEYFSPRGFGRITHTFTEERQAREKCRQLSHAMLTSELVSRLDEWVFDQPKKQKKLLAYMREHFPDEFQTPESLSFSGVPEEATPEQLDDILAIIGVMFYEVFSFSAQPRFFAATIEPSFFAKRLRRDLGEVHFGDESGMPAVFESREACEGHVLEHLTWLFESEGDLGHPGLTGSYEKLSELPEALRALLNGGAARKRNMRYDEKQQRISLKDPSVEQLRSLAALLKHPPYTISELSLEEAKLRTERHDGAWKDPCDSDNEAWKAAELSAAARARVTRALQPFLAREPFSASDALDALVALGPVVEALLAECDPRYVLNPSDAALRATMQSGLSQFAAKHEVRSYFARHALERVRSMRGAATVGEAVNTYRDLENLAFGVLASIEEKGLEHLLDGPIADQKAFDAWAVDIKEHGDVNLLFKRGSLDEDDDTAEDDEHDELEDDDDLEEEDDDLEEEDDDLEEDDEDVQD